MKLGKVHVYDFYPSTQNAWLGNVHPFLPTFTSQKRVIGTLRCPSTRGRGSQQKVISPAKLSDDGMRQTIAYGNLPHFQGV